MRSLEGLLVKLWKDVVVTSDAQGVTTVVRDRCVPAPPRAGSGTRSTLSHATARFAALALVALAMLGLASTAMANQAQTILEKCGHSEPFSGYSQKAYREALKQMTTTGIEYGECESLIRKAEEAAAGGGAGADGRHALRKRRRCR